MTIFRADSNARQGESYPLYMYGGKGGGVNRNYAIGELVCEVLTTEAIPIDTTRAGPIIIPRTSRVDRIKFEVTTAAGAGGVGRVGIYRNRSRTDPYPTQLVVDSGEFSTETTGIKEATISVVLHPGLYWLACVFGVSGATVRTIIPSNAPALFGWVSSVTNTVNCFLSGPLTYGPLPDPFPESGINPSRVEPCAIGLRFAE